MKKKHGILPLLLAALALLPCFAPAAGAEKAPLLPAGLVGIANRGDRLHYPENSLEGALAAAETGIDGVLTDVSLTADGVPVAMEAQSAARMLAGAEDPAVGAYTLEALQSLPLRDRQGGEHNAATAYHAPTLAAMLDAAKTADFIAVLRFDAADADAVTKAVDAAEAADRTVLCPTGKKKAVRAAAEALAGQYRVMTELRSNIVFEVTGWIGAMRDCGAAAVNLKTTNRYGINYYPSVLRRFGTDLRAAANTAEPETCGARTDCEKWWDDLVSRGYSVIVTDLPAAFAEYRDVRCAHAREALAEARRYALEETTLPSFKKELLNDWKKAYDDALREAEALLDAPFAAARDMQEATAALKNAVADIDLHYEELTAGTAGVTVTPVRLLLCALAAAAVLLVQIYFYKKRKKG